MWLTFLGLQFRWCKTTASSKRCLKIGYHILPEHIFNTNGNMMFKNLCFITKDCCYQTQYGNTQHWLLLWGPPKSLINFHVCWYSLCGVGSLWKKYIMFWCWKYHILILKISYFDSSSHDLLKKTVGRNYESMGPSHEYMFTSKNIWEHEQIVYNIWDCFK